MTSRERSFVSAKEPLPAAPSSTLVSDHLNAVANGRQSAMAKKLDEASELRQRIDQMRSQRQQQSQQQQQLNSPPAKPGRGAETKTAFGPIVSETKTDHLGLTRADPAAASPAKGTADIKSDIPAAKATSAQRSGLSDTKTDAKVTGSETATKTMPVSRPALSETKIDPKAAASETAAKTTPTSRPAPSETKTDVKVAASETAVKVATVPRPGLSETKTDVKVAPAVAANGSVSAQGAALDAKPRQDAPPSESAASKTVDLDVDSLLLSLAFASVEAAAAKFSTVDEVEAAFKEEEDRLSEALKVAASFDERRKLRKAIRDEKQNKQDVLKLLAPAAVKTAAQLQPAATVRRYASAAAATGRPGERVRV